MPEQGKLQTELQELEGKLEAKKQQLREAGAPQLERVVFKQVVKEHASSGDVIRQDYSDLAAAPANATVAGPATAASRTLTSEEETELDTLIAHAFTNGIVSAVAEAKKTNDPYLIDRLHDRLADEYYQKLLDARQITDK